MTSATDSRVLEGLAAPEGTDEGVDVRDVEAARGGDRTAFERLYVRHGPLVHGILLARVPHDAVCDLVQDVFLKALRGLDGLREPESFSSWLATLARRRAADHLRKHRPVAELPEGLESPRSQHEEALAILGVIRSLPEAFREPLILRLIEGMTGPEIARRLDMTHGSVRVNLHRGMQRLRGTLRERGHHG